MGNILINLLYYRYKPINPILEHKLHNIKPKKKPRQRSQVQHSKEIQVKTQTQPSQVTHNPDNTKTNQRVIKNQLLQTIKTTAIHSQSTNNSESSFLNQNPSPKQKEAS
ncbi:Hypothetical_protein [Hexamita inflata]|uniref:Hypothetical_protein n=1 Tax=Hexamita inflata TaxID=28002 RepID=A0AA86TCF5_9EUKA|nr:Hypothetical protein HINF_LOCUS212 [Hexamita inflata]